MEIPRIASFTLLAVALLTRGPLGDLVLLFEDLDPRFITAAPSLRLTDAAAHTGSTAAASFRDGLCDERLPRELADALPEAAFETVEVAEHHSALSAPAMLAVLCCSRAPVATLLEVALLRCSNCSACVRSSGVPVENTLSL